MVVGVALVYPLRERRVTEPKPERRVSLLFIGLITETMVKVPRCGEIFETWVNYTRYAR